ncbi:MAG: nitrogenase-stabilizing/protective protein NifW [Brasilonema octagenarum HA4186-MV1]|jgi:nitrogenase-stabilizing/protective protein|uniref:Nitrogenase-stabilizing/protective protein NifW n=1 Tax=Brasilonema octagenarum UFV-OR1 TaxID=417115 RepID=A0ABX1MAI8_9CYAN|nr:nitrogenase-stabilizing/protective protein NifW [Brasilonema octagenarum]MBW4629565.1 nitrogenase-stabilizing/protective protein NifW [Brasilonema octagenarum HA4186-MV1]NMF64438.1 nitrogenase stabilizing/protective protein [Brasilonema octagenarum UFV-OR1]
MTWDYDQFKKLEDAEEYFQFFQLPYDQKFVNVNRLHILKKFSQLITEIDENYTDLSISDKLNKYREALEQAYQVFLESTPQEQKLFKVFNQKPKNVVTLTEITSD